MITDLPNPLVLIEDFLVVTRLAGAKVSQEAVTYEVLRAPHQPPSSLPKGKMAVYVFVWRGRCLKVGKVGPRSQARYTSQHYIPSSSNSNLAKSLLSFRTEPGLADLSEGNVGDWIKANVDRVNFLVDAKCGIRLLSLFESFLQCRLRPEFEGFESQR